MFHLLFNKVLDILDIYFASNSWIKLFNSYITLCGKIVRSTGRGFSLELYFVPELNSTSPSTGELGELVEDVENDELNKDTDDDEDAVEDILYMRGASFTIHLDPPPENSTTNSSKIIEETSPPVDRVELRATSQVCIIKFSIFRIKRIIKKKKKMERRNFENSI